MKTYTDTEKCESTLSHEEIAAMLCEPPELKADKGQKGGSCNRRACQSPGAMWFNQGTDAYYCAACARAINDANPDTWRVGIQGPLCVHEWPDTLQSGL